MASVYIPQKRNILRIEVNIRGRKTKTVPLTPELKKDYQWLRNLVNEMEAASKSATHLSDKSQASIRKLRSTNPQLVQEMTDEGWFVAVTDYTIEEAFSEYITQKK